MSMQQDHRGEDGPGLMEGCAITILVILALIVAFAVFALVACSKAMPTEWH